MFSCSVLKNEKGFTLRIACGNCHSQGIKSTLDVTKELSVLPGEQVVIYANCKKCGRGYQLTVHADSINIQDIDITGDEYLGP